MTFNKYKQYLITTAINSTREDIEKIISEVNDFVKTDDGINGYKAWKFMELKKKLKRKELKPVGKIAWNIFENINPITELKEF